MSFRKPMLAAALGALIAVAGCDSDLIVSAYNLDIGPTPARPGDMVVASFHVNLLPAQEHSITIVVDGEPHLIVTEATPSANPVVLELGDASTLIETYGTGVHVAHVEVLVTREDKTAKSASVAFELLDESP
ncbi:MAG: hypothetical protein ACOC3J_07375 [Gemmatimonadota bacterium]